MEKELRDYVIKNLLSNKVYSVKSNIEFKCIINMLNTILNHKGKETFGYAGHISGKIILFTIEYKDDSTVKILVYDYNDREQCICFDDFSFEEMKVVLEELENRYKDRTIRRINQPKCKNIFNNKGDV